MSELAPRGRRFRRGACVTLLAAAACGDAGPVAPAPDAATGAPPVAARTQPGAATVTPVPVVEDAVDRVIPSLGGAPGLDGVATAFGALLAAARQAGAAPTRADAARIAAAATAARAALAALPADDGTAAERDALALALDTVQPDASR